MVVNAVSVSGQPNSHGRQRRPSMSRVKFEDDSELIDVKTCSSSFEQPPTAMARVPYWQMRAIAVSIKSGGYLSPTLYAPRMMWLQSGSKFAGKSIFGLEKRWKKLSSFIRSNRFICQNLIVRSNFLLHIGKDRPPTSEFRRIVARMCIDRLIITIL